MTQLAESLNGLPNICGNETLIQRIIDENRNKLVYLPESKIDFHTIKAAYAIALHMHQPLIPGGGDDLKTAEVISNLKYMMDHQDIGDNHNAPIFQWCYRRMGELIPQLVGEGKQPRCLLEYSGTLLHGLHHMGLYEVIDSLKTIASNTSYRNHAEWLGAPWGHPVAPSTPTQDYRLHVKAWQHHFAAIFGTEALARVRGFSPSEMALPNHPDIAYEFVKTLNDCGYQWVLIQEHTIEKTGSGQHLDQPHLPQRLVCRNAKGETAEIIAIIKTQGSDAKLVAQMQPYYQANSLTRWQLAGKSVPLLVTQIADGENGGVMMNEFPAKYQSVVHKCSYTDTPIMNVTEYLEHLFAMGITPQDLPTIQPIHQQKIWDKFEPGDGSEKLISVIDVLKKQDHLFHMDGGSWTNNLSWVKGYENILGSMEKVSVLFNEKVTKLNTPTHEHRYRNALFHLLTSQTSCYRYWGQGIWTDYGRELCRRTEAIITHDF